MKKVINLMFFLYTSLSFGTENKIAIIDDFSNSKSHGHLVSKSFSEYKGDLKFKPEVIELNVSASHLSFYDLINLAIELKVKVINLSFESVGLEYNYEDYRILKKASDAGIWIVVASGNYGQELKPKTNPVYPCMYRVSQLVCIGASVNNKVWEKSNYGSWVFAYADGVLGKQIGTSFSAPKISQAIMLFYENSKNAKFDKDYLISSFVKETSIVDLRSYESQITYELKTSLKVFKGPI
jgi:hypothetical protein